MSIRYYLVLTLSLLSISWLDAATNDWRWQQFKELYDLVILIKYDRKNEERLVKLPLKDLSDPEGQQPYWIEREDFISTAITVPTFFKKNPVYHLCNCYEVVIEASPEDTFKLLYIGMPEPYTRVVYTLGINHYQRCISAFLVPNNKMRRAYVYCKYILPRLRSWFADVWGKFHKQPSVSATPA